MLPEQDTSGRPEGKTPREWQKYWAGEMAAADTRLESFIKRGNRVTKRFLDERNDAPERKKTARALNFFHTNVSTLLSMLFGQTPVVDVAREHQDPNDDIARVASTIIQRMLEVDVRASGEDLSVVLKSCLQDRLLPGLGIARVRYTYGTTTVADMNGQQIPQISWEDAPIDYLHWQDVRWGWCRNWKEMPWIAFRSFLRKDEVEKRFGKKVAKTLPYKNQIPGGTDKDEETFDSDQKNNIQKAEIWEIWSKTDKRVFWWCEGIENTLDIKDDPLKLDGFWPVPKPMMANLTTTLMVPTADFTMAQDLYDQIDILFTRIAALTDAVKVVGVYDQGAGGSVGRMLQEGNENDLIPVENWAMFAEKGGLKGVIDWFPVQDVVQTLATLRQILGETIELLYQVTGMSDVLRGANTDQYTSDGTNQLKAKFGSIRIQALQDEFARFASDLEGLKAEVIAKHFMPESIAKQSGVVFLPQADHDKIQPALQLIKSPEIKWRIDIRPESIAMIDYAQLKSERTEFLTAMATYIQSAQAMVQQLPGSLPVMLEMLKWGMSGFKGSDYLEGIMDQAIQQAQKAPAPQQDDGKAQEGQLKLQIEQMKQQTEQMKIQGDMQKIQAKSQADLSNTQAKIQGELAKITADSERDLTIEQIQQRNTLIEIQRELEADIAQIQASTESSVTTEMAQAEADLALERERHENNMREIRENHRGQSNNTSS